MARCAGGGYLSVVGPLRPHFLGKRKVEQIRIKTSKLQKNKCYKLMEVAKSNHDELTASQRWRAAFQFMLWSLRRPTGCGSFGGGGECVSAEVVGTRKVDSSSQVSRWRISRKNTTKVSALLHGEKKQGINHIDPSFDNMTLSALFPSVADSSPWDISE
ncbi:hypothetical protein IF1G_01004 [Cordyceps javanica]|uniref:Uncharacterized protein n=1 Tax=Cordyceps javanica TaxID=43265 RepID=A0A545VH78_9HYPO|nr:hypothetical protein IF1G_01004 [Cordyceps javanica]